MRDILREAHTQPIRTPRFDDPPGHEALVLVPGPNAGKEIRPATLSYTQLALIAPQPLALLSQPPFPAWLPYH